VKSLPESLFEPYKIWTPNPTVRGIVMKQDEKEDNFSEEGNTGRQVYESPEDAFKKALEIERIDDSQLPHSITKLFNN
jgi:hypothetical protein